MADEVMINNPLQQKVDNLKAMSLLNNIHSLTPPTKENDNEGNSVAIVVALRADQFIIKTYLELKGMMYDPLKNGWIHYRDPVMNERGIGNFIQCITTIAETIEFLSFHEDDIPKTALFLFKQNYPYFTIYYKDYELEKGDFNLISTALITYILSALNKSKGAGHRNVVRGTYSEDLLGRMTADAERKKAEGGLMSGLAGLNPFKRR